MMDVWQSIPNAVLAGPPAGSTEDYVGFRRLVSLDIPMVNPSGGVDYYVDGNTNNTVRDGASWATAYATLTPAMAASHANIALSANRAWARRNRIFCIGDNITENLTTLAQKTDIIGVGQADGQQPGCRLEGNHVIAGTFPGCRFINMQFIASGAGATIMTLVTGQGAAQFIGCRFLVGATCVVGLKATAVTDLVVQDCEFDGTWVTGGFSKTPNMRGMLGP